jgi:TonB-dependent receptor
MRAMMKLLFVLWAVTITLLEAAQSGTVSVYLLKDGKPLGNNQIIIDTTREFVTDRDGGFKTKLSVGKHQIEVFAKDENGQNLAFFKRNVVIKQGKDTQILASFSSKKPLPYIEVDTPKEANEGESSEKITGEGTLEGKVLTSDTKSPIANARVFVKGTSVDTRTDAKGLFSVKVPAGRTFSIAVVHSAYSAQTLNGLEVKPNAVLHKTISLTPSSTELDEFVVLAPKVEGSITEVIQEEKNLNAVANILGAEEISKKGDSDAASALKRVSGITLIGGKSIFVRGLGERYSNVEMNSMPLPSPDPTKRVVPLDLFPASAIGSMKVQKSSSADIPAGFGGGYIDIRTKDTKAEDFFKIKFGLNGSTHTGDSVINYKGSDTDFLGFDDGYRDIPNELTEFADIVEGERVTPVSRGFSQEDLQRLTKAFVDRKLNLEKQTLPIGYSFGLEGLQNIDVGYEHDLSIYANYAYGQKHSYYREEVLGSTSSGALGVVGEKRQTTQEFSHDALFNVNYSYNNVFNLKYTKLFSHIGAKNTKFTDGIFGSNGYHYQFYDLNWEERTMSVDQLNGDFVYQLYNMKNIFEFGLEYATATFNQPNDFTYSNVIENNGAKLYDTSTDTSFLGKKIVSEDIQLAGYFKNKLYPNIFDEKDEINFGMSYSYKDRASEYQKFYLSRINRDSFEHSQFPADDFDATLNQYIRNTTRYNELGYQVESLFQPADYYDAEISHFSTYVSAALNPYDFLAVNVGLRYVGLTQTIFQYEEDKFNRNAIARKETSLEVNTVYPSISLKYKLSDEHQFDLAIAQTYVTPDLREFTGGQFFHPNEVAYIEGNPDLVPTQIYNFDLKYSYFLSSTEFVKFGTFFKFLDKPIEDTAVLTTSLPKYSFINSDSAVLYGIEFDVRKKLDFMFDDLSNYYISSNFSYTESEVTLTEDQKKKLTSDVRQLQGLSNIVFNATLGYDTSMRNVALSYNKMGERLRKVGLVDAGTALPDLYEVPPHLVDFVWQEKFKNDYAVSLKLGNLLDAPIDWKRNDIVIQTYKKGRTYSLSVSKKF